MAATVFKQVALKAREGVRYLMSDEKPAVQPGKLNTERWSLVICLPTGPLWSPFAETLYVESVLGWAGNKKYVAAIQGEPRLLSRQSDFSDTDARIFEGFEAARTGVAGDDVRPHG